ncbi:MAG: TonB-dependent receptor [Alphaproteobacteria bacterium]
MPRARLLCTSILVSAALALPAFAQDEASGPPPVTGLEPLVITGTRLQVQDYVSPNPTTSADARQIETSGDTNLGDFLTDYPALVSSLTDQLGAETATPYYVGLNLLDLRNLGTDRTLVLVNGRRHVAAFPGSSAVDVNSIPTDLVERVEILTGGASAVYGADGVSGVVNFILKDNFEGVSGRAQYGWSQDGGGESTFISFLAGRNFRNNEINATFAAEYSGRADVKFNDRYYTRAGIRKTLMDNPAELTSPVGNPNADDPAVPDQIPTNNLRYYDSSPGGSIYTRYPDIDFAPRFLGNGDNFVHGVNFGGFISIGGSGTLLDQYNDDLIPGVDRWSTNFLGHYDVNEHVRLFTELKYSHSTGDFTAQPSYDYGLLIPTDNPFIPNNVRNDAENNPDGFGDFVLVARDNFDLGATMYTNTNTSERGVFGIDAKLSDDIDFEASYVYGRATQRLHYDNVRINERFFAATDVVLDGGHPVCRSSLDPDGIPSGDVFAQFGFDPNTWGTTFTPGPNSGCVPTNIFGEGHITQAARDWINTSLNDTATIDQNVLTAYITGSTRRWFSIPNSDPASFVLGGEYRNESSDYEPDPLRLLADQLEYPITAAGRASVTKGSFHVAELFGELSAPLFKDRKFAKLITVQGAYRYSEYSTSGATSTWNAGARWQFNNSVMLRGTRARAVRAPNIGDLFQGRSQTFESLTDPCSHENITNSDSPATRLANCQADLVHLGYTVGPNPGDYTDNSSEAIGGFITGNPNLKPEVADTQTIGLVITPTGVPGLSMSVDWYKVKIKDAITAFSAQTIVDNCYDLARPNPFCDLIDRLGPGPNAGRLSDFTQIPGNIAQFETSGADFTVRYDLDPMRFGIDRDIGKLKFELIGNILDRLAFVESSGAATDLNDGDFNAPNVQMTADIDWFWHKWDVDYGYGYFSRTRRVGRNTRINNPDIMEHKYWDYSARREQDIRIGYTLSDKAEFYGGINNFTNQKPEFQDYYYPVSPLGRFFYLGIRVKR